MDTIRANVVKPPKRLRLVCGIITTVILLISLGYLVEESLTPTENNEELLLCELKEDRTQALLAKFRGYAEIHFSLYKAIPPSDFNESMPAELKEIQNVLSKCEMSLNDIATFRPNKSVVVLLNVYSRKTHRRYHIYVCRVDDSYEADIYNTYSKARNGPIGIEFTPNSYYKISNSIYLTRELTR